MLRVLRVLREFCKCCESSASSESSGVLRVLWGYELYKISCIGRCGEQVEVRESLIVIWSLCIAI